MWFIFCGLSPGSHLPAGIRDGYPKLLLRAVKLMTEIKA